MEGEWPFFVLKRRKSLRELLEQQIDEMSSPVSGGTDLTMGQADLNIVQNVSQSLLLHSGVDSMDIPIAEPGTKPGLGDDKISSTLGEIGFNANTSGPLQSSDDMSTTIAEAVSEPEPTYGKSFTLDTEEGLVVELPTNRALGVDKNSSPISEISFGANTSSPLERTDEGELTLHPTMDEMGLIPIITNINEDELGLHQKSAMVKVTPPLGWRPSIGIQERTEQENGDYPLDEDDVDVDLYPVDYVDGDMDGDIDNNIENDVEKDGEVKVSINFKLGSMGRSGRAYEHLNSLHDQTRLLGVDMTWGDAIREEFGVELDPGRYFMRRVDPSAPQHNLNSPISALLAEFNTPPTGDWRVTIIDRVQRQKALGPPPKPKPQQPQPPPAKKARLNQTLPSKPAAAAAAAGTAGGRIVGHGRKSEQLYRHRPQKTWVVGHDSDSEEDFGRLELPKIIIKDDDHDDDDASSDESQNNVVIPPKDDLKSAFLERIRTHLTGEMLLEAEDALREQKASSDAVDRRDRWTRWASICPYPVTILRSLFDV